MLAPVYHVLSTYPCLPSDGLALNLAGEKSFTDVLPGRCRDCAYRSRLPEGFVGTAVAKTAATVHDKWPLLPERDIVPAQVLERIDAHIGEGTSVPDPKAGGPAGAESGDARGRRLARITPKKPDCRCLAAPVNTGEVLVPRRGLPISPA
jgi:hypothetical protein